jgi:hypothetical protein
VNNEKRAIEHLLRNISDALKIYTVKELNEALIAILSKKNTLSTEIDYTMSIVAEEYKISVSLLKQKHVRGKVQDAKQICYCLLNKNLGLSKRHIGEKIFCGWVRSVSIGINRFDNANVRMKTEKEFLDTYNKLNIKLTNYLLDRN